MTFGKDFQRFWWILLIVIFTLLILEVWTPPWIIYSYERDDYLRILMIVWIALMLVPLFSEISFLGIGVKRDVRELRNSVIVQKKANRLYWLGNDLASIRFQIHLEMEPATKRKLIEWQFTQALEHARAANIPKTEYEKLNHVYTTFIESKGQIQNEVVAQNILEIQKKLGDIFEKDQESKK